MPPPLQTKVFYAKTFTWRCPSCATHMFYQVHHTNKLHAKRCGTDEPECGWHGPHAPASVPGHFVCTLAKAKVRRAKLEQFTDVDLINNQELVDPDLEPQAIHWPSK